MDCLTLEANALLITRDKHGDYIKIYINGMLHVCVKQKYLLGLQAWVDRPGWYVIEFTLRRNVMKVEYNTFEKWNTVLKLLEECFE